MKKLLSLLLIFCGCSAQPVRYAGFAIGTTISLTLYGQNRPELWQEIMADFEWLDATMTIWERAEPSELNRANARAGDPSGTELSPELAEVVGLGLEYSRLSGGALDITLGPLVQAWGVASYSPKVPSPLEVQDALRRSGLESARLEGNRLFLDKPGMILDLGGVAKGWMADRVARRLEAAGVKSAIVDIGGNIVLVGTKPDGTPWRVGVQDPLEVRGRHLGILETRPTSVVTSGIYERYFDEDGVRYHHIFDRNTGFPVDNEVAGVTVVHPVSGVADVLSTAVFVLGVERGSQFAQEHDAETIFVTRDKRIFVSPGLRNFFTLTRADYTLVD